MSPRNRTELLQEMVDIGIALTGERDLATLLESIVQHARRFTRAEGGMLFLREDGQLRPAVAHHAIESPDVAVQVASTGRLVNSGPTLTVPLRERTGDVIGVLVLMNARDEHGRVISFDADYETLVPSLAAYAAAALHNARVSGAAMRHADNAAVALENADLARRTERKLKQTETLLSVSRALSSTLDLQSLLRHFLRRVAHAVDADTVGSYMLDTTGEWLTPLQGYRLPPEHLDALRRLRLSIRDYPFYAEGARTKRAIFSRRAAGDPRIPPIIHEQLPHQSQLFVPIVTKDRVIGGLVAVWWHRDRDFSDSDLALIEAIATQAGVALENARLFDENVRQVRELQGVHDVSRAITGKLDQEQILFELERHLERFCGARAVLLLRPTSSPEDVEVLLHSVDRQRVADTPRRMPRTQAGLAALVLGAEIAQRTDDYLAECRRHQVPPLDGFDRYSHWMAVPLVVEQSVTGVLAIARDRVFDAVDQRALSSVGQLAALALQSAVLFQEQIRARLELATAQEELVRSEKLRALGEMASGVAHDFNNLLVAILSRAQLLLRRPYDATTTEWLRVIERAAQDGAQTVRRLQEFTHARTNESFEAVNLNEIAAEALEITATRWRTHASDVVASVRVETRLATLPSIAGDPVQLREVLTNLILNALDAMPAGGLLAIATQVSAPHVVLTVADTGTGMPEEVRRRVFDPFFTTKGSRGTGLGLSVAYGIVARHGGQIEVESAPGVGTTFRLQLPIPASLPPSIRPAEPEPAAGRSLRCLIVDDDPVVAGVLRDALTADGHSAQAVHDGAAALALIRAERFDVVVTDFSMPGVTGWEVAKTAKATQPATRVILMSGYVRVGTPDDSTPRVFDQSLRKPVDLKTFFSALSEGDTPRA